MKIGILTYFSSHNYGAFLQAYALRAAIEEYTGETVEIINYRSPKEVAFYSGLINRPSLNPKRFFEQTKKYLFDKKLYNTFERSIEVFQKKSVSELVTDDLAEINNFISNQYDLLISGSDEIWKTDGFRGFPNAYWFPYIEGRKFSYAASSRNDIKQLTYDTIEKIRTFLKDYEYIGVRDRKTLELVSSILGSDNKVFLNCDPTFLFNFNTDSVNGKRLLRKRFHVNTNKKIIGIMISDQKLTESIVKEFESNFEFVSLYTYSKNVKCCGNVNPFEWNNIISACDGFITSFFHGTVFSIKNNVPFLSIELRSADRSESKIYDLLERNNLLGEYVSYGINRKKLLSENIKAFLDKIKDGSNCVNFKNIIKSERNFSESFFSRLSKKQK